MGNQRGLVAFKLRPVERMALEGEARLAYAYDPIGLAMLGIFRADQRSAVFGRSFRLTRRTDRRGNPQFTLDVRG